MGERCEAPRGAEQSEDELTSQPVSSKVAAVARPQEQHAMFGEGDDPRRNPQRMEAIARRCASIAMSFGGGRAERALRPRFRPTAP